MSEDSTRRGMMQLIRHLDIGLQPSEIFNFHQQTEYLVQKEIDRSEKEREALATDASIDAKSAADSRLSFYRRYSTYLRQNTFLMQFSHLEEMLAVSHHHVADENLGTSGFGIRRFVSPYHLIGVNLTNAENWDFLLKCQEIRNALLHANGRISLLKKPQIIEEILSNPKWKDYFCKRSGLFKLTRKGKDVSEYIEIRLEALNQMSLARRELEHLIFGD